MAAFGPVHPGRDTVQPGPHFFMEWYFTSLCILWLLVTAGGLTGHLLLVGLPTRMQPGARLFLSVPLGWAWLTLVASLLGWFGPGYAACHCAAITLASAAAGAWVGRSALRRAGGDFLRLSGFCVLASFPMLGSLLRTGSFALYNDTYLYAAQATWLQQHSFWTPAHTDGGHPAWGAVALMQNVPLRMGASFLLGWVHAACGLETPYQVYPAVAALGLICGALAAGATVLAACPGRWPEAWLTALAVAVTLNGFTFGAAQGFLPQTWGLAFAAAAFGLRGLELGTHAERSGRARWRTGVPLGICAAASMHCYWDLLPLEGAALASTYLLPWPGRSACHWREQWRQARVPLLTSVALVNLEWGRAVRGILYNLHALAANPVNWPVWHFPAHALGLKASVWEGSRWMTQDLSRVTLSGGVGAVLLWLGVVAGSQRPERWRHWLQPPSRPGRWHWRPLIPALAWTALTGVLFVHFRYEVPSPWHGQAQGEYPDGVGQSWSQYKVTIWASLYLICLVASLGAGWAMRTHSWLRRGTIVALLVAWCGTGVGWNFSYARRRGKEFLRDTGMSRDPFAACLAIRRRLAAVPAGDWVYLDWPSDGRGDKLREVMAVVLSGHPLASDWSTGELAPFSGPQPALADCDWVITCRPSGSDPANPVPGSGGMTLEKIHHRGSTSVRQSP